MVNPPQVSLKVIVVAHFVLTIWASMVNFLGPAYVYMSLGVLAFGFYSVLNPENTEAVFMFMVMTLVSIVLDIIFLGVFTSNATAFYDVNTAKRDLFRFSLGMAIVNLILKPVSSFILYRIYQERGGQYSDFGIPGMPNFGIGGGGQNRASDYENIDQSVPSSSVETASPHSTIEKSPLP